MSIRTDEEFLELFAGTPIMRAKRRGLMRNACVVAGNSGQIHLLEPLRDLAEGEDALLREHANWAIAKIMKRPQENPKQLRHNQTGASPRLSWGKIDSPASSRDGEH